MAERLILVLWRMELTSGSEMNVWYIGLITAVHTCFVANREIIHVAERKGAVIF